MGGLVSRLLHRVPRGLARHAARSSRSGRRTAARSSSLGTLVNGKKIKFFDLTELVALVHRAPPAAPDLPVLRRRQRRRSSASPRRTIPQPRRGEGAGGARLPPRDRGPRSSAPARIRSTSTTATTSGRSSASSSRRTQSALLDGRQGQAAADAIGTEDLGGDGTVPRPRRPRSSSRTTRTRSTAPSATRRSRTTTTCSSSCTAILTGDVVRPVDVRARASPKIEQSLDVADLATRRRDRSLVRAKPDARPGGRCSIATRRERRDRRGARARRRSTAATTAGTRPSSGRSPEGVYRVTAFGDGTVESVTDLVTRRRRVELAQLGDRHRHRPLLVAHHAPARGGARRAEDAGVAARPERRQRAEVEPAARAARRARTTRASTSRSCARLAGTKVEHRHRDQRPDGPERRQGRAAVLLLRRPRPHRAGLEPRRERDPRDRLHDDHDRPVARAALALGVLRDDAVPRPVLLRRRVPERAAVGPGLRVRDRPLDAAAQPRAGRAAGAAVHPLRDLAEADGDREARAWRGARRVHRGAARRAARRQGREGVVVGPRSATRSAGSGSPTTSSSGRRAEALPVARDARGQGRSRSRRTRAAGASPTASATRCSRRSRRASSRSSASRCSSTRRRRTPRPTSASSTRSATWSRARSGSPASRSSSTSRPARTRSGRPSRRSARAASPHPSSCTRRSCRARRSSSSRPSRRRSWLRARCPRPTASRACRPRRRSLLRTHRRPPPRAAPARCSKAACRSRRPTRSASSRCATRQAAPSRSSTTRASRGGSASRRPSSGSRPASTRSATSARRRPRSRSPSRSRRARPRRRSSCRAPSCRGRRASC